MSRRAITAAVVAAALGAGGGAAFAATQSDGEPSDGRRAFLESVAAELGVQPEALEDAFQAAARERLDEAVADGRLSEERAAEIRERIEQGLPPMHGRHHGPRVPMLQTAAEFLGLEVGALVDRLRSGDTLADIARAEGKTAEALEQALVDEARRHIHELVNSSLPEHSPGG